MLRLLLVTWLLALPSHLQAAHAQGCPEVLGYSKQVGVDHIGDNVGGLYLGVDPATAAARCSAEPSCNAFNLLNFRNNAGTSLMMSVTTPLSAVPTGGTNCFYTKLMHKGICPAFSGYSVQVGVDHVGDDVGCDAAVSASTAAARCSADGFCNAFNLLNLKANGTAMSCRKAVTGPTSPRATAGALWGISCFYTKLKHISCPVMSGYSVKARAEHFGDDIACDNVVEPAATATLCSSDFACVAFSFDINSGLLGHTCRKYVSGPTATYATSSERSCFYNKLQNACPVISGYSLETGVDHKGDDLECQKTIDPFTAAERCSAQPSCKAFNLLNLSNGVADSCRKAVAGPATQRTPGDWWDTSCFYVKLSPPGPPPAAAPPPARPSFSSLSNLAKNRPTYASSATDQSFLAVDGGKGASSGVFETAFMDLNNWLSIDLGGRGTVHYIILYSRKDCCANQLINTEIRVGDAAVTSNNAYLGTNQLVTRLNMFAEGRIGQVYNISLDQPLTGSWVTIQNFNRNPFVLRHGLALLELEVYGEGPASCGGTTCPSVRSGSGGGTGSSSGFRFIHLLAALIGVMMLTAVVVTAVTIKRRRMRQAAATAAFGLDLPPRNAHNAVAAPNTSPTLPYLPQAAAAAAAEPVIGTPVYGTPVSPYYGTPVIPTSVVTIGGGDMARPVPEWMRKHMEPAHGSQQQPGPGDAGSSSTSSAAPPPCSVPPAAAAAGGFTVTTTTSEASGSNGPKAPAAGIATGDTAEAAAAPAQLPAADVESAVAAAAAAGGVSTPSEDSVNAAAAMAAGAATPPAAGRS